MNAPRYLDYLVLFTGKVKGDVNNYLANKSELQMILNKLYVSLLLLK